MKKKRTEKYTFVILQRSGIYSGAKTKQTKFTVLSTESNENSIPKNERKKEKHLYLFHFLAMCLVSFIVHCFPLNEY